MDRGLSGTAVAHPAVKINERRLSSDPLFSPGDFYLHLYKKSFSYKEDLDTNRSSVKRTKEPDNDLSPKLLFPYYSDRRISLKND